MAKKKAEIPNINTPIEGIPSKELFITMLVRDITLKDAIGDLVDNSIDSANRNSTTQNSLKEFTIKITIDKNSFEIWDNCGGIEEDVARNSAFKLGKPKNYVSGKHTIGQFGIGMKRAFFKLGEKIEVDSKALKSSFKINIDVLKWRDKNDEKDWDFNFESVKIENHNLKDTFTNIKITNLKEDAKKQFAESKFLIDLKNEIALEQLFALNKGLNIQINEDKLKAPKINLIYDNDFKPSYWKHDFKDGLKAEILAGISEDNGEEGGWYIFCNDRLILGPDTSETTGWSGGRGRDGKELPKYHDQFFRFRGYVFFNADDSSKLPWNTTKTGMDKDSPDFVYVRSQMIAQGKQVKSIMDDMKKEREKGNPLEKRSLSIKVNNANVVAISEVIRHRNQLPPIYKYPKELMNRVKTVKDKVTITFEKPKSKVQKAIEYYKTNDVNKIGSLAFEYFYDNELK
jgi:Histidine kinase-, DNA gyrase B-, and HSP90-like ATPase